MFSTTKGHYIKSKSFKIMNITLNIAINVTFFNSHYVFLKTWVIKSHIFLNQCCENESWYKTLLKFKNYFAK